MFFLRKLRLSSWGVRSGVGREERRLCLMSGCLASRLDTRLVSWPCESALRAHRLVLRSSLNELSVTRLETGDLLSLSGEGE